MNDVMPIQLSTSVENVILLLNKMEVKFVKPFVIFYAVNGFIATDVMSIPVFSAVVIPVVRRKSFKQSAKGQVMFLIFHLFNTE